MAYHGCMTINQEGTTPTNTNELLIAGDDQYPCDQCGAEPNEPCRDWCTAHPDSTPILVRAVVTKPDGDRTVVGCGYVPAWLWDDPQTRELWKRDRRPDVLSHFTAHPRQARGYRVAWEAFEEVPQP